MSKERESLALPASTVVGRYQLRHVQTTWGFCLTYAAEETGTGRRVLVHELLPEELVRRAADGAVEGKTDSAEEKLAWARERFALEGRALAGCVHRGVQRILEVFEANGTAYWVTPMEDGRSLKRWLEELGRAPTEAELRILLAPLLSALQRLHAAGLYHLNLKLETIRTSLDGKPTLVHFGGSRQAIARHCYAADAVTPGYSPIEQYDPAKAEGPWTDIYSLAAVLHRAITGNVPAEATSRLTSDPYQKLGGSFSGEYRGSFLMAIDAALAPDAAARPRSIDAWQKMLDLAGDEELRTYVRQHPRRVAAGAAAIAVVVGVTVSHMFHRKPVPPIGDDSHHEEKQAAVDERGDEIAADKAAAQKAIAEKDADHSSQNQAAPPPTPPPAVGGQVGTALGGIWETTQKNADGLPLKRLIIYSDAHYELSGDATDTGTIFAKLGIISMESERTNGAAVSTFKYKSMSEIDTEGALGKLEWVRVSASAPERARDQQK